MAASPLSRWFEALPGSLPEDDVEDDDQQDQAADTDIHGFAPVLVSGGRETIQG
jgi:hypothetical protein